MSQKIDANREVFAVAVDIAAKIDLRDDVDDIDRAEAYALVATAASALAAYLAGDEAIGDQACLKGIEIALRLKSELAARGL